MLSPGNYFEYLNIRFFKQVRVKVQGKSWVFTRTACLGNDVFDYLFDGRITRLNLQKGRLDFLIDTLGHKKLKSPSVKVVKLFDRRDVVGMVWAQLSSYWTSLKPPSFILMDSFSDLTDREYIFRKGGARFACHSKDLKNLTQIDEYVHRSELLPIKSFEANYSILFKKFYDTWGDIPIIFIHFPSLFEVRKLYQDRAREIRKAIENISMVNPNVYSITAPESVVFRAEESDLSLIGFPYHFRDDTKRFFSDKVAEILSTKKALSHYNFVGLGVRDISKK